MASTVPTPEASATSAAEMRALYLPFQRRPKPLVPFNAKHYRAPACMFNGIMPHLHRGGASLWSMLMTAVRFTTVEPVQGATGDSYTVMLWPQMNGRVIFYEVARQALVDETALAERYVAAGKGKVCKDPLKTHESLRPYTAELDEACQRFDRHIRLLMALGTDPVVIAATLIAGVVRIGLSKELEHNVMVGCIVADLVLGGHRYPLITPHQWMHASFQKAAKEQASRDAGRHEFFVLPDDPFIAYLRQVLDVSARPTCDTCGVTEENLAKRTVEKPEAIRPCEGCGLVLYCCEECKQEDAAYHQKFCNENRIGTAQTLVQLPESVATVTEPAATETSEGSAGEAFIAASPAQSAACEVP